VDICAWSNCIKPPSTDREEDLPQVRLAFKKTTGPQYRDSEPSQLAVVRALYRKVEARTATITVVIERMFDLQSLPPDQQRTISREIDPILEGRLTSEDLVLAAEGSASPTRAAAAFKAEVDRQRAAHVPPQNTNDPRDRGLGEQSH
jgi:hypothetical protein